MSERRNWWKLWLLPNWDNKRFALHYEPDQVCGVMYAGFTVFGWSLMYSDHWHRDR